MKTSKPGSASVYINEIEYVDGFISRRAMLPIVLAWHAGTMPGADGLS